MIVPVFQSAPYIEECATTLFQQDFDDVEFIFVDDASPDDAIFKLEKVIKNYPHRQVKILRHSQNQGSGASRRTGLFEAKGSWILHLDSDDYFEPTMLSSLYREAQNTQADMLICDHFADKAGNRSYVSVTEQYGADAEQNFILVLFGRISASLCTKLVKRKLYFDYQIFPIDVCFGEDLFLNVKLHFYARKENWKVCYLPQAFFYYRHNPFSTLNHPDRPKSDKFWQDIRHYAQELKNWLEKEGVFSRYQNEFHLTNMMAIRGNYGGGQYKKYIKKTYPESDRLRYVLKSRYVDWKRKILYSFCVLNLGGFTQKLLDWQKIK